jgi:hypothetical protein
MVKWVGGVLGSIFTITVIGAGWFLTSTFGPALAAKLTPPPAPPAAIVVPATGIDTEEAAPADAPAEKAASAKVVKSAPKHATVAVRQPTKVSTAERKKSIGILARHDSKKLRAKRDEIDRLLGL